MDARDRRPSCRGWVAAGMIALASLVALAFDAAPAQAQSWHYQNCLRNSCLPAYWSCRQVGAYANCAVAYKQCQGVCWGSHQRSRALYGSGLGWGRPGYSRGPLYGHVRGHFAPRVPRHAYPSHGYRSYGHPGRSFGYRRKY